MSDNLAVLKQIPFLRSLSEKDLKALGPLLTPIQRAPGDILFRQGERGDSLYFIREGRVKFTFRHNTGTPNTFEEIGPGQFFGEVAVFTLLGVRTATAEVTEALQADELRRSDLIGFMREHPEIALGLLGGMAERLQRSGRQLQQAPPRNVHLLVEEELTPRDRMARWVAQFAGSPLFLALHAIVLALWIIVNALGGEEAFDPFPFHFLGVLVGVEALVFSCFVLMNQYREDKAQKSRDEEEYRINVIAGQEVGHLHERVDVLMAEFAARLPARGEDDDRAAPPEQ